MYKNVGESLKSMAKLVAFLGIIAAIGIGGYLIYSEESSGFSVIIFGSLFAILMPIGLYAFGEIVENTAKTVKSLEFIEKSVRKLEYTVVEISEKPNDSNCRFTKMYCPNCGNEVFMSMNEPEAICKECGKVIYNKTK